MPTQTEKGPTIIGICERLERQRNTPLEDRRLIESLRAKVADLVSIDHSTHRHIMHVRSKLIERYPKGTLMYMILKDNLPHIREKIDEVSPENDIEKAMHDFKIKREARDFCNTYVENLVNNHAKVLNGNAGVSERIAAELVLIQNIRNTARKWKMNPEGYQRIWVSVVNELFPDAIKALRTENTKNNRKPYNLYVLTSAERKKARREFLADQAAKEKRAQ